MTKTIKPSKTDPRQQTQGEAESETPQAASEGKHLTRFEGTESAGSAQTRRTKESALARSNATGWQQPKGCDESPGPFSPRANRRDPRGANGG